MGSIPEMLKLLHREKIEMLRDETCENRVYPIISFNSQSERVVIYIILMTLVYLILVPTSSHEPRQAQFPSCTWCNAGAGQTKGWNSALPMRLAPGLRVMAGDLAYVADLPSTSGTL